jgi:hypothetical protein
MKSLRALSRFELAYAAGSSRAFLVSLLLGLSGDRRVR